GLYRPSQVRGAMFQSEGFFSSLRFGFDEKHLYLRLDPARSGDEVAREVAALRLVLNASDQRVELEVPFRHGEMEVRLAAQGASAAPVGGAAFRDIFELALPFEKLGVAVGTSLAFAVRVMRGSVEVERLPRYGYLTVTVPDADYERKNWKV
ncbi:MAG: glycoside hydrolase, partial [Myxococcales bacterium]